MNRSAGHTMFTKTAIALAIVLGVGLFSGVADAQAQTGPNLRSGATAAPQGQTWRHYQPVMPFTWAEKRAFDYQNGNENE